jgi:spore germination protein KC
MILISVTGCWNYREVDELSIVAGVAIDKGIKDQFEMTVEIIDIGSGKDAKMKSKIVTAEGKTMFDAARNMIALSVKRLYWSHAKVIILSKDIASQGIMNVIEWYQRDAETREDVALLISQAESAKEIFIAQGETELIKSFELSESIKNQRALSKAPIIDIMKYSIELNNKGTSTIIPTVNLKKTDQKNSPQITGSAIIKNDKLVGFLNSDQTKDLLFIRDEIKGGILVEEIQQNDIPILLSLEIYKSKTKIKPVVEDKNIKFDLDIHTTVAVGEIEGSIEFFNEQDQIKLEQSADNKLKERIELLIQNIQSQYGADIFGFGSKLQENKVEAWNSVKDNWEEVFKNLAVNIKPNVHIKNSGMLSKTVEKGD